MLENVFPIKLGFENNGLSVLLCVSACLLQLGSCAAPILNSCTNWGGGGQKKKHTGSCTQFSDLGFLSFANGNSSLFCPTERANFMERETDVEHLDKFGALIRWKSQSNRDYSAHKKTRRNLIRLLKIKWKRKVDVDEKKKKISDVSPL